MKKAIWILKNMALAELWLGYYLACQVFALFGLLIYKITHDFEYCEKLYEELQPYYETGDVVWLTNQFSKTITQLLAELIGPTMMISAVPIIGLGIIKIWKKKESMIQKISIYQCTKYIFFGISINLILSLFINIITTVLPENMVDSLDNATEIALSGSFLVALISVGILAPIMEEIIFRYGMQRAFANINPKFAIVAQAIIFGALHGNLIQGSYATIIGLTFGVIFYKTSNLLITILLHSSINASSVILAYASQNEYVGFLVMELVMVMMLGLQFVWKNKNENSKNESYNKK